jgi:predicted ArsR family transcriptional regulator
LKVETGESLNRDLVMVLAHPVRVQALHILGRRGIATPKQIADEIGLTTGNVAYHVRELEKVAWVELVKTEPRRGATAHFYRATKKAIFTDEEWVTVPPQLRATIVGMELRETGKLLSRSLGSGVFEERANRHHSMYEGVVDQEGWDESMTILAKTMEQLLEAAAKSQERNSEERIPMVISIIGFEKEPD